MPRAPRNLHLQLPMSSIKTRTFWGTLTCRAAWLRSSWLNMHNVVAPMASILAWQTCACLLQLTRDKCWLCSGTLRQKAFHQWVPSMKSLKVWPTISSTMEVEVKQIWLLSLLGWLHGAELHFKGMGFLRWTMLCHCSQSSRSASHGSLWHQLLRASIDSALRSWSGNWMRSQMMKMTPCCETMLRIAWQFSVISKPSLTWWFRMTTCLLMYLVMATVFSGLMHVWCNVPTSRPASTSFKSNCLAKMLGLMFWIENW